MEFEPGIEPEDFIVRVRPMMDGTDWTGQIDMSIISSPNNNLDDESYAQLIHLCKMICATVPIMEMDETFGEYVHNFVLAHIDKEEIIEDTEVDISHEDGNVVHLNFGTKTKGNA
jgi:hypothetical protein